MRDETKNTEKTSIGKAKPKFQQTEPAELNEVELQIVSGGAVNAYPPTAPC